MDLIIPEWMKNPQEVHKRTKSNWVSESGNIECACGEIIHISSSIKRHDEKLCRKCNLMYEYWNNKDGTGLRFNVKGYFPFYPDGYKFTIERS